MEGEALTMKGITKTHLPGNRRGPTDDYLDLVMRFPLAPIKSDRQLKDAFKIIDELAIIDEERMTGGQSDYLSVLSDLVEKYENASLVDRNPFKSTGDLLVYLLEQSGMTASDLGRLLGNRQTGSAILRGERELSKTHISTLADYFKVSTDLFLFASRD